MESKHRSNGDAPRAIVEFVSPDGDPARAVSRRFGEPVRVLRARAAEQVRGVLDAAQAEARAGRWCIGFVAFEAAPAFDAALEVHDSDGPLAWFAVFDDGSELSDAGNPESVRAHWDDLPRDAFDRAIDVIRAGILVGDQYQVNLTGQLKGRLDAGRPLDLFAALRRAQPGGYAVYLDTGEAHLLSVSPELFFDWHGDRLLARPMKGTAPRGGDPDDDARQARALRASEKERAENVMIVDLIRNDLSRVAAAHSVRVPRLFELQPLPTVWQMTSDVVATTRPGTTLSDVFTALFPCGSVTGAPKVQAMRTIRALEPGPRGAYCGAIGVLRPGGDATFNVGIRTVTARGQELSCGIGSGVTAGSSAAGEWREWRHKRGFLERARAPFALLETLALESGLLRHVDAHLARMSRAARHFGYPWDVSGARACLASVVDRHPSGRWRVRLQVDAQGQALAEAHPLDPSPASVRLALAGAPFEAADSEFVRFKTTRREHYEAALVASPEAFDTLLWNERGELTECTRGNIAVRFRDRWLTPPLSCGLLDGVGRSIAVAGGRLEEGIVRVDELPAATGIAFVNSLRGWIPATLL